MATLTELRRDSYNEGRAFASKLLISSREEASVILNALADETTVLEPLKGNGPLVESYTKGFRRKLIERCETFLNHTEDD